MARTTAGPTNPSGRNSLNNANAAAGPSRLGAAGGGGAGLGKGKGKTKSLEKNTARKSTGGKAPRKSAGES